MADLRRPILRFAVGVAASLLVFFDVQGLLQTLHSQAKVRDRVVAAGRDTALRLRPALEISLTRGDAGLQEADLEALRSGLVKEFEIFDVTGMALHGYPAPAPVRHWLGRSDLAAALAGQVLTFGPFAGNEPRLLAYMALRTPTGPGIARFSMPVPQLVEDLRERRDTLLAHAASLSIVIVGLAFLLLPRREEPASGPRALDAYEEAMGRLRDRGEALSREQEARRLALEERLEATAPMARAGELTAGMAHEVRNGLGTMLGYARLIERGAPASEAQAAATAIREECEALETVVRRFVDFVKDETLQIAPFDLRRLLNRVVARESRGRAGASAVVLPGPDVALDGDEEMLERAFENLVRNGREAAGPEGRVEVSVATTAEATQVTIADDGPGLSPEERGNLRPFLTTKAGGLGLGLPIVYKIVGLHGGTVLMGDRSPHGLAVSIFLPRPAATNVTEGSGERPGPGA